ncbi:WXG100 family type VII secretion target [Nocardioides rubriscoriae]|uniref:WXG100 family type VII secretion target n=1 Tax=Nocardioides rubriscoriae TaxID=642762 RepID=UPI0011DF52D0|nr:WXG100 family type VII secretion target [Nocardioides rubriscoriae]
MGDPGTFSVDRAELDAVITDLQQCEADLERITTDLERRMAVLHETWEGLSAQAQRAAHQEWEKGMRAMHAALTTMRRAARTAHDNYTAAVDANVSMWERVQ